MAITKTYQLITMNEAVIQFPIGYRATRKVEFKGGDVRKKGEGGKITTSNSFDILAIEQSPLFENGIIKLLSTSGTEDKPIENEIKPNAEIELPKSDGKTEGQEVGAGEDAPKEDGAGSAEPTKELDTKKESDLTTVEDVVNITEAKNYLKNTVGVDFRKLNTPANILKHAAENKISFPNLKTEEE